MTHVRSDDPLIVEAQWRRYAEVTREYLALYEYAGGLLNAIRSLEKLQSAVWIEYSTAPELIRALPLWITSLKEKNINATRGLLKAEAEMEELKTTLNGNTD